MIKPTTSYKINDNLYLALKPIAKDQPVKAVEQPTNHIAVIDCSGSMWFALPQIRTQLKKKLPKLLKAEDTISLMWFSGRGEFGVLLEGEPVQTLKDLGDVEKAIDRWLKPVGLTGFKEPLEEVPNVISRVSKKYPNPFSLFFLSDGADNQWSRPDILKAVETAAGGLASSTFVEYGYYADRALLASMAEKAGGTHIFSEDFDRYEPVFDAAMQRRLLGGKRIEVTIEGDPIGGFSFMLDDGVVTTFDATAGKSLVNENATSLMYLTPRPIGSVEKTASAEMQSGLYAALSLYAVRMKSDVIFALLKNLGDVTFIKQFTNCFGKQKYSEFQDACQQAAFRPELRLTDGYNPSLIPADDAFTVLDALQIIAADKRNTVMLEHPSFQYSKISRAREAADENFSAEEQQKISEISAKMATEKNAKKLKELQAELGAVASAKKDALKFETDKQENGYSVSNLTFNEDRPNVSILIRKTGKVDIEARLKDAPEAVRAKITDPQFRTNIYRNYAIIKDGLANVETLPVRVTDGTCKTLMASDPLAFTWVQKGAPAGFVDLLIPVRKLPVVNRKMVNEVSAKNLFDLQWSLTVGRAAQKVYSSYRKERFGKKSEALAATYGDEVTAWLQDLGFTDNGFAPKMVQAESTDVYMGKELSVALKGYSSPPSVKDVKERMEKAKTSKKPLTGYAALMEPYVREVETALAQPPAEGLETWLEQKEEAAVATVRNLIMTAAKTKFAIVVGQVWFKEFKTLEENTMTLPYGGADVVCKVDMQEVEIKI